MIIISVFNEITTSITWENIISSKAKNWFGASKENSKILHPWGSRKLENRFLCLRWDVESGFWISVVMTLSLLWEFKCVLKFMKDSWTARRAWDCFSYSWLVKQFPIVFLVLQGWFHWVGSRRSKAWKYWVVREGKNLALKLNSLARSVQGLEKRSQKPFLVAWKENIGNSFEYLTEKKESFSVNV